MTLDKDFIWKMTLNLEMRLHSYLTTLKNAPYDYTELRDGITRLDVLIHLMDSREQEFMEWATRSSTEDGYYYNTPSTNYGIVRGYSHPECYQRAWKNLVVLVNDYNVFTYFIDEYEIMQKAKSVMHCILDRDSRTCDKCETRFDSYNGMARHYSRCKGDKTLTFAEKIKRPTYRGNYHGKPDNGWSGGTVSSW